MFCGIHEKRIAITSCVQCRKGVCAECQTFVKGRDFCPRCASSIEQLDSCLSVKRDPLIALLFSIIPGFGQVYNGQAVKGVIFFFTFWLVLPWFYGMYDAYTTAKEISQGKIPPKPFKTASWHFSIMVIIFLVGPFALFKGAQHYIKLKSIDLNSVTARHVLVKISKAAEAYEQDYGYYPEDIKELYLDESPYLDVLYCGGEISGYLYKCNFTREGYSVTAWSIYEGKKNIPAYTIGTGGVLELKKNRTE
ncbi:MAG: hypothetical protein KAJ18_07940 [Candidatus Omnitrophica bacterium]|nr:hypothetical protein [Candidatus Omnitrophota bacterium]